MSSCHSLVRFFSFSIYAFFFLLFVRFFCCLFSFLFVFNSLSWRLPEQERQT